MDEITVIAHIHARPEALELVSDEVSKLVSPTRGEPGCLQYDLHVDVKDPGHFFFYERWESIDHHMNHMDSAHMSEFVVNCKGSIQEANVHHLSKRD